MGINILERKSVQFRQWLEEIAEERGLQSELTIEQIFEMLNSLDRAEKKMDEIILETFEE